MTCIAVYTVAMHPGGGLVRILQSATCVYCIGPRGCEYPRDWTMRKTKMTFKPIQQESHVLLVLRIRSTIIIVQVF